LQIDANGCLYHHLGAVNSHSGQLERVSEGR